jgi:hypothetical protein
MDSNAWEASLMAVYQGVVYTMSWQTVSGSDLLAIETFMIPSSLLRPVTGAIREMDLTSHAALST